MRICLFTDTYFPQTCKRSTYIKTLYDNLVAQGNRVMIIVPEYEEETLFVEEDIMHCPARKLPIWQPRACRLGFEKERFRRIKEFNPDVLHAHDCSALGMFAIRSARRFDLPLIFTFHDPAETRPDDISLPALDGRTPAAFYRRLAAKLATALHGKDMRTMLTLADLITSASGKAQSRIRDLQIDRKVEYFPDSVNSAMFHPDQVTEDEKWSLCNRFGLTGEQKVLLFAGVLSPDKNLNALLSIWARRLRDEEQLRFVIAGSGSEKANLEQAAKDLGISEQIIFTGSLSHDEMAVLYSISTLYLSALVSDTIPLSMLEAMSAGVPVLLKYDPDNLNHITERRNGFFFRSGKELAALIQQFSGLSESESAKIRESVRRSAAGFSLDKKTDALIDAYNRTISRHYNGHE